MTESILYKKLKRATPDFDWERHEDKFTSGIPDCSYGAEGVGGWVELKTYDCWPRLPEEPLVFTDLKPTQVNWCMNRGKKHPLVWFLVQVNKDWFLISWEYSRMLGKLTKDELLALSHIYGSGPISKDISWVLVTGKPFVEYNPVAPIQKYKVKYYYLATGMDGRPDKWQRIVTATNSEDAINQVLKGFPEASQPWLKNCLSASPCSSSSF